MSGRSDLVHVFLLVASPLPAPPARLLDGHGHLDLFEDWLFNDNGQFQLRTTHSPQATTID